MKDEIKEILYNLKMYVNDKYLLEDVIENKEQAKLLLDYITNLQENKKRKYDLCFIEHLKKDKIELQTRIEILNNQVNRIKKNLEKLFDTVLYEEIYKEKDILEKDYNMTISELREKFIESMLNKGD